ncbi:MAG: Hsp33 family molecular chaperone HslO [Verrucomicrobiaceae bacterium]|nr:Hsp33 family molecular chaperone HslO [Verrucomicrobiaceae bacterium]
MLNSNLSVVEAKSSYVRGRNVLLARAKFGPLYMDYYLHLMQHGIRHDDAMDAMLKDALAVMTLHLCSRPQDEVCAWTINITDPLLNVFVTGGSRPGRVTGRIFTDDVKQGAENLFISQTTRPNHQARQSMIAFRGTDVARAAEEFYEQSEQRVTRIFRLEDEEFAMLTAEPDCDVDWLRGLRVAHIAGLDTAEHLVPLETRGYAFECGCSIDRLYPLLARLSEDDLEAVFADGFATVTCPRCGAIFNTPRDHFDEWRHTKAAGG